MDSFNFVQNLAVVATRSSEIYLLTYDTTR